MDKLNISNGIYLDSYNVFIQWDCNEKLFNEKIKTIGFTCNTNSKFGYKGYRICTKLFSLPYNFVVTFNFVHEVLTSVNVCIGQRHELTFDSMQKILVNLFGKAKSISKYYYWKCGHVIIKHYIINTFSTNEIIEIVVK